MEHKVKSQSDFRAGRTAFSRKVTLTCQCGKAFTGEFTGRRNNHNDYIERRALEKAETAFRAHLPIR